MWYVHFDGLERGGEFVHAPRDAEREACTFKIELCPHRETLDGRGMLHPHGLQSTKAERTPVPKDGDGGVTNLQLASGKHRIPRTSPQRKLPLCECCLSRIPHLHFLRWRWLVGKNYRFVAPPLVPTLRPQGETKARHYFPSRQLIGVDFMPNSQTEQQRAPASLMYA